MKKIIATVLILAIALSLSAAAEPLVTLSSAVPGVLYAMEGRTEYDVSELWGEAGCIVAFPSLAADSGLVLKDLLSESWIDQGKALWNAASLISSLYDFMLLDGSGTIRITPDISIDEGYASIGIEYDDVVDVVEKSSNYYAGKITGLNGEIVVVIGNGYTPSGEGYEGNNPIYAGTNFAIWEKGVNGSGSTGGGGTEPGETVTLSVNCDVGMGNAIFFTGSFTGANEWKTALRGTYDEATRKWIFEVPAGSFEWKCLKGSYDLGESVTIEGSGLVWESGDNHLSTVTEVNPNF